MTRKRRHRDRYVQREGDPASGRGHRRHLREDLERADVEAEARVAEPQTAREARELSEAVAEGREAASDSR